MADTITEHPLVEELNQQSIEKTGKPLSAHDRKVFHDYYTNPPDARTLWERSCDLPYPGD